MSLRSLIWEKVRYGGVHHRTSHRVGMVNNKKWLRRKKIKFLSDTGTDPGKMHHSARRLKGQAQNWAIEGSSIGLSRMSLGFTKMYNKVFYTFAYMQKRVRSTKAVSDAQRGWNTARAQEWCVSSDYCCQKAAEVCACNYFHAADSFYAPVSTPTPSSQNRHCNSPKKGVALQYKKDTSLNVDRTELTSR